MQCAFCAFYTFFVEVQTNGLTYMQCMRNNNLEIRIAGSSCILWLSFIQIQTCQYILANSFQVKLINAWDFRPVMTGVSENIPATSAHFQQFFEDFQTLPKKCVKLFWQPLSNSEVILSVKGKLNCIFVINHVLKNNIHPDLFVRCEKLSLLMSEIKV